MLSKRPEDRYQRPIDIINDVVNLADQLGLKINKGGHQWAPPDILPVHLAPTNKLGPSTFVSSYDRLYGKSVD